MDRRIVLIRHGRSTHPPAGWFDRDGFLRWRARYEAAGIVADDRPPRALIELVGGCPLIVTSTARRAIESALRVAASKPIVESELLVELALDPPPIRGIRLPPVLWAAAFGVQWLVETALRRPHASIADRDRVRAAARWLDALAQEHGSVAVLTHASFRRQVARELSLIGWQSTGARHTSRHWSALTLARRDSDHDSLYHRSPAFD
jgi:phosphohistidine phosphatase SixA